MTGFGTVASYLGLPDAGLATYTDMVGRVRQFAEGTKTPIIADGDTGYGGLLNVDFTVRGYEAAALRASSWRTRSIPKSAGTRRAAVSFRSRMPFARSRLPLKRDPPRISSSSRARTHERRLGSTRRSDAARPSGRPAPI